MTTSVRYEGRALTALLASDAAWIASLRVADRAAQQARLDVLRAREAALVDGRALAYVAGATAQSVTSGGLVPADIAAPGTRVIVIESDVPLSRSAVAAERDP